MKKLFSEIPRICGGDIELRRLCSGDADALRELTKSEEVYRYLPTFLFEKKYDDAKDAIARMYDECLKESLILGIFSDGEFCGLAEFYGYRAPLLKISIGYRLLPRFWGKGIATRALGLMTGRLFCDTNVKIITASVIPENKASAAVLEKNGFRLAAHSVPENWGHALPTKADKWIRTASGYRRGYSFHPDKNT
ncbi:MAG: GNAT family N-acetyltransferase [Clostridia bacterium]|nr:GNAT family N-acetyltransferase [Clostridia bacterium]